MATLPVLPNRMRVRAVIMERRGMVWATGTGLLAIGRIDRDLCTHPTANDAEREALALADSLDLLAVRS